ncbi:hypothetical protein [Sciscionella sediminilitoris]|uniref:hypothetical protein n=1 Tax=Sciscionella sediminilitoris TaxID=1445613 RepID=UPI0004DF2943|nr:hypothetical protein [Sciscionella sp. SE31]
MPFVELFAPKGSLDEDRRTRIGEDLVAEVMRAEGAPDTEAARSISWLTITEIDDWFVGGTRTAPGEPPRFVVKVSVPAGSMNEAKRTDIVERVTKVLADSDPDPRRFYERDSGAWVHIYEIPEGNWGAFGRVVRIGDILEYVTTGAAA